MKENEVGVEEGFYQAVADVLKCDSNYKKREFTKRTRWNNRSPGNGRFIGHGSVRFHGPGLIHVQLYNPKLCKTFKNADDAILEIKSSLACRIYLDEPV